MELVHVLDLVVVDTNDAPTDLTLTGGKIGENQEAGAVGGLFDAVDEDGDAITYTLVLVDGETPDPESPLFEIDLNVLKSAAMLDHELHPEHEIRVRATDEGGLFIEEDFVIEFWTSMMCLPSSH